MDHFNNINDYLMAVQTAVFVAVTVYNIVVFKPKSWAVEPLRLYHDNNIGFKTYLASGSTAWLPYIIQYTVYT